MRTFSHEAPQHFHKMNINVVPANGMVQAEAKAVKGKVLRRG